MIQEVADNVQGVLYDGSLKTEIEIRRWLGHKRVPARPVEGPLLVSNAIVYSGEWVLWDGSHTHIIAPKDLEGFVRLRRLKE